MHELTITPQGHLLVRETPLETPDRKPSKALLEAYRESPARGMLYSASEEMDAVLPPSFEFARSIARLYLTNLCKAATAEPGEAVPEIPPPAADLDRAVLQAPPMTGLEYLTPEVLADWWRDLDSLARGEIAKHPGGAQGYLRERNPQWRFVGRVTFHLAENKREPGLPVRLPGHVRQRPDAAGQGEARTPRPGASAVRRGAEPRGDAQPAAPDLEGRRILGIDPTARRFRGDLSPPRVVAARGVRLPQGDPPLRIERPDRAGAGLVERPEADPAPRQREDRLEESGGHRRRRDAANSPSA